MAHPMCVVGEHTQTVTRHPQHRRRMSAKSEQIEHHFAKSAPFARGCRPHGHTLEYSSGFTDGAMNGGCVALALSLKSPSLSLGTRGDLPSGQMLSFCWFCAKLAQPLPTRQMLGKF